MSDGSPVVIEQLGGSRLRLELQGADLPDQDVEVGVKQRVKRWYLAGSPEPTTHVLGPQHDTVAMRGEFSDAATLTEGAALAQLRTLLRIVDEGAPVRVTWGDTWDRDGLLDSASGVYARSTLIGWRAAFTPQVVRDGDRKHAPTLAASSRDVEEQAAKLGDAAAGLSALSEATRAARWFQLT